MRTEFETDFAFKFSSDHFEENSFRDEDLIQLKPVGISVNADAHRPTLLLKNEEKNLTLPVPLTALEAGVTLTQSNQSIAPTSPHKFTQWILESLNIQVSRCVFVEIKGSLQYVRLYFEGHPQYGSYKLRADEAMSVVLHLGVQIYATQEFMHKSKVLQANLETLAQGLQLAQVLDQKNRGYIQ
ncbi:MAG: bifunctional nuclease domain-containing protein [Pseudobdellovibrionaceae bacterium]|jgi:bifunctional DNase/RNase